MCWNDNQLRNWLSIVYKSSFAPIYLLYDLWTNNNARKKKPTKESQFKNNEHFSLDKTHTLLLHFDFISCFHTFLCVLSSSVILFLFFFILCIVYVINVINIKVVNLSKWILMTFCKTKKRKKKQQQTNTH